MLGAEGEETSAFQSSGFGKGRCITKKLGLLLQPCQGDDQALAATKLQMLVRKLLK